MELLFLYFAQVSSVQLDLIVGSVLCGADQVTPDCLRINKKVCLILLCGWYKSLGEVLY